MCADFVRQGAMVADIGTDHAYLPIFLVANGISPWVLATDLREGPLRSAARNILKFGVDEKVHVRLSDGLCTVLPDEVDDVIIAGMGGELIARIIHMAPWLKTTQKHLILQPMASPGELRAFLRDEGFSVLRERAVISRGRVYTVMEAVFSGTALAEDPLYEYIGALKHDFTGEARLYISHTIRGLRRRIRGLFIQGDDIKAVEFSRVVWALEDLLREDDGI